MPEGVEEQLGLDVTDALAAIQTVSDALDQVVQGFSVGLATAIEQLVAVGQDVTPLADSLDVAGLGTAIDAALAEASTPVPIEGDTSGLETAIADATGPETVEVDADTGPAESAIGDLTDSPATISVDADTIAAKDAIDSLDNEPITLSAEVDVAGAQDQIDQLSQSVSGLGGAGSHGGEELAGLEGAVLGVRAATGAATGEVDGLAEGVGHLSSGVGVAVGGLAAFGAFIGETTKLAADAQAQNRRFTETFGELAEEVEKIDVGGLNTDLETLGKTSGTTAADLEATASRIGLLGQSSGASNETIVSTTQNLLALGATISVNNPRLGDAAAVTDRLTNAFARGGRALAPFGLALSSAQINAEALKETGKETAAELTLFEKSTAGANLALQTFGDNLGAKFQEGSQNAQVQLRALKVQLEETLVAIGGPLLGPLTASLTDLLPVAEQVGIALGKLASDVLPLLAAAAPILAPLADAIGLIGDGLEVLGPAGIAVAAGLAILIPDLVLVSAGFGSATVTATAFGVALDFATGPVGIVLGSLAALGAATHLFGGSAKEAAVDTSGLADAFTETEDAAGGFHDILTRATDDVDAYIRKQLALKTEGVSGTKVLTDFGATFADIDKALTGPTDALNRWNDSLRLSHDPTDEERKAVFAFADTLFSARDRLEANAKATLEAAVANGTLTDAQRRAAIEATRAADGSADYITALRELTPVLDEATAAANTTAEALSTTSPAFADLTQHFAQGKITVDTLTTSLAQFGFVGSGAADEAKKIGDALTQLLNAEGALPTVGSVMDDFAATVKRDFEQVSEDVAKGTGNVQDDLAKLANDSDPQRFAENLNEQTANILKFTDNLRTLVAEGFGGLAASLAEKGPEVAGGLAASLASEPAKAKVAAGAEQLSEASRQAFDTFLRAHFPELAQLGEEQGSKIAGGAVAGLEAGAPAVGQAVEGLGKEATAHFRPDFTGAVDAATRAAAQALAADPTVTQAAGEKALEVVRNFAGLLTPDEAVRVALGRAKDVLQADQSVPGAAGKKGEDASKALKPDFNKPVQDALSAAASIFSTFSALDSAAKNAGRSIGSDFGAGLVEGMLLQEFNVEFTAAGIASSAANAARAALRSKSPSLVAKAIGVDFTKGLVLGLVDSADDTGPAAKLVADSLVIRLQKELADGIAKVAAQASAASALNAFSSAATARLPTIGGDISSFFSGITQAQNAEAQALTAYHKAYSQYADDQDRLRKLQNADSAFQRQLLAAKQTVANAQNKLDADTAAKNQDALAQDRTNLDAAQARLKALQDRLAGVRDQVRTDQSTIADAAKELNATQKALAAATSPDTFIKNLNQQTAASKRFLADIATLKREGFGDLAEELSKAGPEAASKLADAFAGNAGKAKQAEAAIDAANAFATSFTKQIESLFASPTVQKVANAVGQQVGIGINDGIQDVIKFDPSAANKLTVPTLAAPLQRTQSAVEAAGVQTLALDLTINTPDGQTLRGSVTIPVPPPGASLVQQTRAQVKAL